MRIHFVACGFAAALLALTASTAAPQDLPTQKVLPLSVAEEIAHATMDKCRADGYHIVVSVVDSNGQFKAFLRDDGANTLSIEISRRKALTAAVYGRPSAEIAKAWKQNGEPLVKAPDSLPAAGGVPIKAGNQVIGGVGVVGAPGGDKDEACAMAGIAKVADKLR